MSEHDPDCPYCRPRERHIKQILDEKNTLEIGLRNRIEQLQAIIKKLKYSGVSNGPEGYNWIYKPLSVSDAEHDLIASIQGEEQS